jgi:hypothetical protein
MRLAIVGSRELESREEVRALVRHVIAKYRTKVRKNGDPDGEFIVISGGARGVDSMAEEEARALGVEVRVFKPSIRQWLGNGGFMHRNEEIARHCTHLVRIASGRSSTYGSGWTRDRAKELGKPTEEFVM